MGSMGMGMGMGSRFGVSSTNPQPYTISSSVAPPGLQSVFSNSLN
jgi:hypothetical protein